ncbi:MAG: hypothetical protein U5L00_09520 [Desulfovermiculus sp.]|nr:hypothetical protein [Desulfovermiculus sp.]
MTRNQVQDISRFTFVQRANQLMARFNDLDIQFLCTLSRDKVTHNAQQLSQTLSERISSPEVRDLVQAVDHVLTEPEADMDGVLNLIDADELDHNALSIGGETVEDESNQLLGEVPILDTMSSSPPAQPQDDTQANALRDLVLAVCLYHFLDKRRQNKQGYVKQIRDVLSFISQRQAEFLLLAEPLLDIVADQGLAIIERGRASRALINNFNIEQVLIYAALNPNFSESEKHYVFSWLTAYQKVYRRFESIFYDQKAEKVAAASKWFHTTLTALRKNNQAPGDMFGLSEFLQQFVQTIAQNNESAALDLGRALVLTTNNEDIVRGMHEIFRSAHGGRYDFDLIKETYRLMFEIMQDYRMICIQKKKVQTQIKERFARISHQRREMEKVMSQASGQGSGQGLSTPVLGSWQEHALLEETRTNLEKNGLLHLFDLWPLPEKSQTLFNQVCQLKGMIPQDTEYTLGFLLYIEKFLEFLMRLDRLGIKVVQHEALNALLTNAYQIHTMHLLKEGMYLGSTGYWRSPNQRPPSVICITNPGALGNCLNLPLRHINFRVFLGTGQFYESPFILDSTERYGSMDELGGPEQLFMRPGLFLLDIPQQIEDHFRKVQRSQFQTPHFQNLIQMRTRKG